MIGDNKEQRLETLAVLHAVIGSNLLILILELMYAQILFLFG